MYNEKKIFDYESPGLDKRLYDIEREGASNNSNLDINRKNEAREHMDFYGNNPNCNNNLYYEYNHYSNANADKKKKKIFTRQFDNKNDIPAKDYLNQYEAFISCAPFFFALSSYLFREINAGGRLILAIIVYYAFSRLMAYLDIRNQDRNGFLLIKEKKLFIKMSLISIPIYLAMKNIYNRTIPWSIFLYFVMIYLFTWVQVVNLIKQI